MNVWSDGPEYQYLFGGVNVSVRGVFRAEAVKLLSEEEVDKILDYDMIWLPENKTLAKKLEAIGLIVVTQ
jgi:hypothetical protein